ncbi:pantoate--beta-alanine ligase [Streptomyces sp. NPDC051018]|uniref:pantoate--beta-alanine ligase n=1 Tax=Streptomyces sp. NPDC051018 TaxID=3365639 RepID=UPI003798DAB7
MTPETPPGTPASGAEGTEATPEAPGSGTSGPPPTSSTSRTTEGSPAAHGSPTSQAAPTSPQKNRTPGRRSFSFGGGPRIELVRTLEDLDHVLSHDSVPGRTAVVMTMGALHEGHTTLIRAARERVGRKGYVIVTVFVNPLQFGAGEDLDRYPRTLDADLVAAEAAGADLVFAPSADEIYPDGQPRIRIGAGPLGERLEGASRPGHFDGMLTVVAKLLHLTRPDVALYGQKDAQQLALIRRMVRDLNLPVEIAGVETVREDDGLALSSRNRFLSPAERTTALALSRALFAAQDRLAAQQALLARAEAVPGTLARAEALSAMGEARAAADAAAVAQAGAAAQTGAGADAVRAAALAVLDEAARATPPLVLDYLALVDPETFTEVPDGHQGEAILAVAARVGATRLIDNVPLRFGATS